MHASAKLSLAQLRHEYDQLPVLESAVDPLARERMEALTAYKRHQAIHLMGLAA